MALVNRQLPRFVSEQRAFLIRAPALHNPGFEARAKHFIDPLPYQLLLIDEGISIAPVAAIAREQPNALVAAPAILACELLSRPALYAC